MTKLQEVMRLKHVYITIVCVTLLWIVVFVTFPYKICGNTVEIFCRPSRFPMEVRRLGFPPEIYFPSRDRDVAIVLAYFSKIKDIRNLTGVPFFDKFLPSFCSTISTGYSYHFYIGYDHNDTILSSARGERTFREMFANITRSRKCSKCQHCMLNLVRLPYSGAPAWAQNDAAMQAYLDNMPYLYR